MKHIRRKSLLLQQPSSPLTKNLDTSEVSFVKTESDMEYEEDLDVEGDDPDISFRSSASMAEQGELKPNKGSFLSKMNAKLILQSKRYAIFKSPEFRHRLREENGVPSEHDATDSTFGLLRSVVDPVYRDRRLGNVWQYAIQSKDYSKNSVRDHLVDDAIDSHLRDTRRGKYSLGKSKLKHQSTSQRVPLRRSDRLRSKKSNGTIVN